MLPTNRRRAFTDIKHSDFMTENTSERKLKINLKRFKPNLPENFEEESWNRLHAAIKALYQKESIGYSREELYQLVHDMCLHHRGSNLYQRLSKVFDKHIESIIKGLADQTQSNIVFLSMVNDNWSNYCQQVTSIRSIFLFLDRGYMKKETSVRSIWDMGLQFFRNHLENEPQVEAKIITGLLDQIEAERKGEAINRSMMKSILRMLISLRIYGQKFEEVFLKGTEDFYKAESQNKMNEYRVTDYLHHVENRLQEELDRVTRYLDPSTYKPLITRVERRLIKVHTNSILEKGFDELMDNERISDLALMYSLFKRVEALNELLAAFSVYVRNRGMEIVQDEARDKEMVHLLLELKKNLDIIIKESFGSNEEFDKRLRDAFEHFINSRENKPAQLIAKFMDSYLRAGSKVGGDEEAEQVLDKAMILFRFINGKDVFQAFYKKDLAKRLLLGKSASTDMETRMIGKLKSECGSQFTNKLEGMFKDIDLSEEFMKRFKEYELQNKKIGTEPQIEMYVHVLTTGCWPAYPRMETLVLPADLQKRQKAFTDFYLSKHEGRCLTWQYSLDYCLLKAEIAGTRKELSVSLFQALVLLLFHNLEETMTLAYKDIAIKTGIENGELKRTLQSLACGKIRVLAKLPKGKEIEEDDKFLVNKDFKSNAYRVKINSIQMKETAKETKETNAKVFQDRQYQIDAAIVRIMKARKSLAYTTLISELFKQLKFPAKTSDLKKRIESLIDREYLERDAEEPHMYRYLA